MEWREFWRHLRSDPGRALAMLRKCSCRMPQHMAADPETPIAFDERLNEFSVNYHYQNWRGKLHMRFCFACGGRLPDSRRSELWQIIDPGEKAEAAQLKDGVKTIAELRARIGEPDHTLEREKCPAGRIKEILHEQDIVGQYFYLKHWRTLALSASEKSTGELTINFGPKPKTPGEEVPPQRDAAERRQEAD